MTFDPFSPPGILTARGSNLSIDSRGVLYVGHGSRSVLLELQHWQWLTLGTILKKLPEGGPITLELESGELTVRRNRLHTVDLRVKQRLGAALTVQLNAREVDDLQAAVHLRATQPTEQESV